MNIKYILPSLAIGLLAFFGWHYSNTSQEAPSQPISSITLWDINFVPCIPAQLRPNLSVSLTSSSGVSEAVLPLKKPLIIHFWAPWCAPCRAELPHFAQFVKNHSDVQIWCVADGDQTPQKVQEFYESQKLAGLPVMIDTQQKLARRLNVDGLPTTVFLDTEGRERGRIVGVVMWNKPEVAALIVRELLS